MTLDESVRLQVKEEIGEEEDTPTPRSKQRKAMVQQKFGVLEPVLFVTLRNGLDIVPAELLMTQPTWSKEEVHRWKLRQSQLVAAVKQLQK